ncbi:11391_t:CDS:2, partial [Gigaspora margarita]
QYLFEQELETVYLSVVDEFRLEFDKKRIKEKDKTFEYCARYTILKKAQLDLKEKKLFFVCFEKGFRQFLDEKEYLYRTAIYFTILDGNIFSNKELLKLKLISSIESNLKQIIEAIHAIFKKRPQIKKYKFKIIEENSSVSSSVEKEIEEDLLIQALKKVKPLSR